jgi:hypothetical protein
LPFGWWAEWDKFSRNGKATIARLSYENSCLLAGGSMRIISAEVERQLFTAGTSIIVVFWLVAQLGKILPGRKATIYRRSFDNGCLLADGLSRENSGRRKSNYLPP